MAYHHFRTGVPHLTGYPLDADPRREQLACLGVPKLRWPPITHPSSLTERPEKPLTELINRGITAPFGAVVSQQGALFTHLSAIVRPRDHNLLSLTMLR